MANVCSIESRSREVAKSFSERGQQQEDWTDRHCMVSRSKQSSVDERSRDNDALLSTRFRCSGSQTGPLSPYSEHCRPPVLVLWSFWMSPLATAATLPRHHRRLDLECTTLKRSWHLVCEVIVYADDLLDELVFLLSGNQNGVAVCCSTRCRDVLRAVSTFRHSSTPSCVRATTDQDHHR